MIITKTPFRVGLLGGGTDYPEYFSTHGGRTFVAAINHYCTIAVRWLPKFFDFKSRVAWSKIEYVKENSEIINPIARECLRFLGIEDGVDITYLGDLPARSGLGTSSAFTVGLLHALHLLKDGKAIGKSRLAKEAIRVERDYAHQVVGFQDQIACSFGGLSLIQIRPDGETLIVPVGSSMFDDCGEDRLEQFARRFMLFYSGIKRTASDVASKQVAQIEGKEAGYEKLADLALDGADIFENGNLNDFGSLLEQAWQIKRGLAEGITNDRLDLIHDSLIKAGATGVKVVGAGAGGFVLAFVPEVELLRESIRMEATQYLGMTEVPFRFDIGGSRVIGTE